MNSLFVFGGENVNKPKVISVKELRGEDLTENPFCGIFCIFHAVGILAE